MATMNVRDSDGATQSIEKPLTPGRAAAVASRPVVLSTEDLAILTALQEAATENLPAVIELLQRIHAGGYEFVGEEQTAQVLGATGGAGDYLARLIIIPAALEPGAVSILDDDAEMTVFYGAPGSPAETLADLKPIVVELGLTSVDGAWKVSTGADVSVIAVGSFTA